MGRVQAINHKSWNLEPSSVGLYTKPRTGGRETLTTGAVSATEGADSWSPIGRCGVEAEVTGGGLLKSQNP